MVRPFTKPDDVHGMIAAKGILTSEGGATSHAAVVARQFGVPCVVGASAIKIDLEKRADESRRCRRQGRRVDFRGRHHRRSLPRQDPDHCRPKLEEQTDLLTLLTWADEICARPASASSQRLADPRSAGLGKCRLSRRMPSRARSYGAVGIGLCRTEHMFFEPERLPIVQRMILAETMRRTHRRPERTAALPAHGLRRSVRGDGRLPGHHPPDRPAAA